MIKITLGIQGMMCAMCEAHTNNAIKEAFKVKSVTSSHKENKTEIMTEKDIDENELRAVVENAGYKLTSVEKVVSKKKGLFGLFGK